MTTPTVDSGVWCESTDYYYLKVVQKKYKYFYVESGLMDNLHVRLNFNLSKEKGIKHHS
jgi:hypothetical protein